jgi:hypothetical protein
MTALQPGQRVTRKTAALYPDRGYNRRQIVAQLGNHELTLWELGRPSTRVTVPLTVAFDVGYKLKAKELAREKAETKKSGRKSRAT